MSAHLPLHVQLKEIIIAAIARGDYAPDDQLPSQRDLCALHHMSHMTVRRAISELVCEGVIYAVPGKGIFVARRSRTVDCGSLEGLDAQLARFGLAPATRILDARLVPASTVLAQTLHVEASVPLVYLHRLRLADGRPLALTTSYLPHSLCPDILKQDRLKASLFDTLRTVYGLNLAGSTNVVSAIIADEPTARLLELDYPTALLVREQITFLDSGQPVEFSRSLTRGDVNHVRFVEGRVP